MSAPKMAELGERKTAAEDELRRIEIRAPQEGTVHELAVHTVGGVIAAGDVIMRLVPDEDQLRVEAKISPQEIDRVTLNQPALLRFTSFDTRSTPEINGKVSLVSAATSFEQKTGLSYYTVHVSIADDEISRLGHARLLPGMPVEVFIETGERTLASYLAKPLVDQFERALKGEIDFGKCAARGVCRPALTRSAQETSDSPHNASCRTRQQVS